MTQNSDSAKVSQETLGRQAPPCAMVIFGAGGDLTKRKLIPALYNLAKGKLLPQEFAIIGVSREQFSSDDFRQRTGQEIRQYSTCEVEEASWDQFVERLYYIPGDFKDPELYKKLGETADSGGKGTEHAGQLSFLSGHQPDFFPHRRASSSVRPS